MNSLLKFLLLMTSTCGVLCYQAPASGRGGPYKLPDLGRYPAPQPTFPRNLGLPKAYEHTRHFRSVGDIEDPADENATGQSLIQEPYEALRVARSAEEILQNLPGDFEQLTREKRSSGYRIIQPTYRPPPRKPIKTQRV